MISYGKQNIDQSDIEAVIKILKGDWLTQGPATETFENDLLNHFGSKYCCAVSNGTAALHLAGLALGWKPKDVIITTPITFLSSVNCIIHSGAVPDFVDIDPESYTIDANRLEDKIKMHILEGNRIKAVIGVDYAGHPCNWKDLRQIADKYEIQLVNDNCHALGASYFNDIQYAVKYADVVIHSYHPVKHITTGEGGALLTNDACIDEKVRLLRTHGMTKNSTHLENNDGPWYYEMHTPGFNYRMTDFQSALGSNQLKRLGEFVSQRRIIAAHYNKELSSSEYITIPESQSNVRHAYHIYPLQINFEVLGLSKLDVFKKFNDFGINLQVHYIPVHLQPYYRKKYHFERGSFSISERFYDREISLPIYPGLKTKQQNHVVETVKKVLKL